MYWGSSVRTPEPGTPPMLRGSEIDPQTGTYPTGIARTLVSDLILTQPDSHTLTEASKLGIQSLTNPRIEP